MPINKLFKVLSKPTFDQMADLVDKRYGYMTRNEWFKLFEDRKFKKFLAANCWTMSEFLIKLKK